MPFTEDIDEEQEKTVGEKREITRLFEITIL